jgi:type II secretory pathway component PulF
MSLRLYAIADKLTGYFAASSWRMTPLWSFDHPKSVQGSLIRLIRLAQSEQLELAPLVLRLAYEHRFLTRWRLEKLAQRLASGTPLLDALEQTPRLVEDQELLAMRFAWQTGTLKSELPKIIEYNDRSMETDRSSGSPPVSYYVTLSLVTLCSVLLFVAFILPVFQRLFKEMELRANQSFRWADAVGTFLHSYSILILPWLVVVAMVAWWLNPFQWIRRSVASRLLRSVAERRSAQLLRLLATASDAGRPIAGSMSTLARYHFDRTIRAKLLFARNEIELGAEAWESLAMAELLSRKESTSIASSTSSKTRSWLMKRIADGKLDKVRNRIAFFSSFIHPTIIILLGLLVLWLALATFGTLATLVDSLSK